MSPLFGKRQDGDAEQDAPAGHLPRPSELGSQLDDVVSRIDALPVEQFAAQVMTQFFKSDYEPGGDTIAAGDVADGLMPPHDWPKLRDPVPRAQVVLQDLAAEAIQLLEHANLIRPKLSYQGDVANFGYITTRRGRTAIEENSVDRILAGDAATTTRPEG